MLRIVIINLLLFIAFIILFILLASGIGYAMATSDHTKETALAYVAVWVLHLYINVRILKKRNVATLRHKVISIILITCAYLAYVLYITYLFN